MEVSGLKTWGLITNISFTSVGRRKITTQTVITIAAINRELK
jgi:hypothetical protein